MAEIINTGIICTGGDINISQCVVGDNATIVVQAEPDED
jgi:hypothetical protein